MAQAEKFQNSGKEQANGRKPIDGLNPAIEVATRTPRLKQIFDTVHQVAIRHVLESKPLQELIGEDEKVLAGISDYFALKWMREAHRQRALPDGGLRKDLIEYVDRPVVQDNVAQEEVNAVFQLANEFVQALPAEVVLAQLPPEEPAANNGNRQPEKPRETPPARQETRPEPRGESVQETPLPEAQEEVLPEATITVQAEVPVKGLWNRVRGVRYASKEVALPAYTGKTPEIPRVEPGNFTLVLNKQLTQDILDYFVWSEEQKETVAELRQDNRSFQEVTEGLVSPILAELNQIEELSENIVEQLPNLFSDDLLKVRQDLEAAKNGERWKEVARLQEKEKELLESSSNKQKKSEYKRTLTGIKTALASLQGKINLGNDSTVDLKNIIDSLGKDLPLQQERGARSWKAAETFFKMQLLPLIRNLRQGILIHMRERYLEEQLEPHRDAAVSRDAAHELSRITGIPEKNLDPEMVKSIYDRFLQDFSGEMLAVPTQEKQNPLGLELSQILLLARTKQAVPLEIVYRPPAENSYQVAKPVKEVVQLQKAAAELVTFLYGNRNVGEKNRGFVEILAEYEGKTIAIRQSVMEMAAMALELKRRMKPRENEQLTSGQANTLIGAQRAVDTFGFLLQDLFAESVAISAKERYLNYEYPKINKGKLTKEDREKDKERKSAASYNKWKNIGEDRLFKKGEIDNFNRDPRDEETPALDEVMVEFINLLTQGRERTAFRPGTGPQMANLEQRMQDIAGWLDTMTDVKGLAAKAEGLRRDFEKLQAKFDGLKKQSENYLAVAQAANEKYQSVPGTEFSKVAAAIAYIPEGPDVRGFVVDSIYHGLLRSIGKMAETLHQQDISDSQAYVPQILNELGYSYVMRITAEQEEANEYFGALLTAAQPESVTTPEPEEEADEESEERLAS